VEYTKKQVGKQGWFSPVGKWLSALAGSGRVLRVPSGDGRSSVQTISNRVASTQDWSVWRTENVPRSRVFRFSGRMSPNRYKKEGNPSVGGPRKVKMANHEMDHVEKLNQSKATKAAGGKQGGSLGRGGPCRRLSMR